MPPLEGVIEGQLCLPGVLLLKAGIARAAVIAGFLPRVLVQHVDDMAELQVELEVFIDRPLVDKVEFQKTVVGGQRRLPLRLSRRQIACSKHGGRHSPP